MSKDRRNFKGIDRWDIYNNVPHGGFKKVAIQCNCTPAHVSQVLHGKRPDYSGIIKAAEHFAAVNIWKTRFCKLTESEL